MYVFLWQQFLAESNTQEYVFTTMNINYCEMLCHVHVVTNVKLLQHNVHTQLKCCYSVFFQTDLKSSKPFVIYVIFLFFNYLYRL